MYGRHVVAVDRGEAGASTCGEGEREASRVRRCPFHFFLKFFSQIDFKHILSSLKSFLEVAPKIKVTQNKILYNFAFKVQTKNPIGL